MLDLSAECGKAFKTNQTKPFDNTKGTNCNQFTKIQEQTFV